MKKITIGIMLFILLGFTFNNALSWDDETTHKQLSEYAANNSVLGKTKGNYLKNLGYDDALDTIFKWGIENSVRNWLQEGAELEDASDPFFPVSGTTRSLNHFHNPIKPWNQAGLDDWVSALHYTGISSLLWAQDGTSQQNVIGGNWSWQKTREYYYFALTSTTDSLRQENFAKTFRGLGHQMHLLQDAAVPDHVRNDAHPEDAIFGKVNVNTYFESWAKAKSDIINSIATNLNPDFSFPKVSFNITYSGLVPITQLFDTEQYDGTNPSASLTHGLAEYTNENFFSKDTIFSAERYSTDHRHYFPYPKTTSTDVQAFLEGVKLRQTVLARDGNSDTGIWLSKITDGEEISYFLRTSKLTKLIYKVFGEGELFYKTFYRDEVCHESYAEKLIPRAVGYSAGLLNYFFRGNIEISLPASGMYAQTDNPAAGFTQITLFARNITPDSEQMNDGTIELVVRYRRAIDDPFLNYTEDYPFRAENEMTYLVVPEKNGIRSIPQDSAVELTFDLSQNPIPLYAIDVYLQVIYHGRLGNEDGAVVVGFKDISEPTPIDLFSDLDQICLNGSFYAAGSAEAVNQVDTNNDGIPEWDIYPHDLKDIYLKVSSSTNPGYATPDEYDYIIPYLSAGDFKRALYILTDYNFMYSSYESWVNTDPNDTWFNQYPTSILYPGMAIKNQTEYVEDPEICAPMSAPCHIWWYPTFLDYRGVTIWWGGGIMYVNNAYPENSECDCYQGILRTCISTTQTLNVSESVGQDRVLRKNSAEVHAADNNALIMPLTHKQRRLPIER